MKLLRRPCVVSGRGLWAVIILMFGGLSSAQEASAPNTNQAPRPHIIFIVADDLGWDDVSFHGSKQIPTPNIDRLAYDGIILNNYYVSPICTPTRSAIMTGRHPIHTGLQHSVIVGSQPYGLPLNETIMPQYFNKLGYTSRMVGKWHLGFMSKEYTPTYRGFQSHFGYWLGAEDYFDHTAEATRDSWGLDFRRDMEVVRNATGHYSTELFSQEAVNIINTHDTSKPLFLYLPFQAVHSGNGDEEPLEAPQKYINRFPHITTLKRKIFAGMVSALDDAVGNVTAALVRTGMLENSIIVFTTDNGGPSNGFDFNAASNWPLRGVKATLWEGGVRGVGFVSSPLLKTSSYVSNNLFHVCDWLPTLYSAAGGNVSVFPRLDGFPMWDMLSARDAPVRTEVLHNIDPILDIASLRIGDYKLVMGQSYGGRWSGWYPPWSSDLDENSLKFAPKESDDVLRFVPGTGLNYDLEQSDNVPVVVKCGTKPKNASTNCEPTKAPCLYHIPSDPCEYNNLANEQPTLVSHFVHRIIEYNNTAVPPLNLHLGQDPAGNPKLHGGVWDPWRP